eukprot:m.344642 g.344642  ORF g.344642 m.344642 type:complete len:197 (-) comp24795_c0_seq1:26-616(-)
MSSNENALSIFATKYFDVFHSVTASALGVWGLQATISRNEDAVAIPMIYVNIAVCVVDVVLLRGRNLKNGRQIFRIPIDWVVHHGFVLLCAGLLLSVRRGMYLAVWGSIAELYGAMSFLQQNQSLTIHKMAYMYKLLVLIGIRFPMWAYVLKRVFTNPEANTICRYGTFMAPALDTYFTILCIKRLRRLQKAVKVD